MPGLQQLRSWAEEENSALSYAGQRDDPSPCAEPQELLCHCRLWSGPLLGEDHKPLLGLPWLKTGRE